MHGAGLAVSKKNCPITKVSGDPAGIRLPLWVMEVLRGAPVLVSQEELVIFGAGF